MAQAPRPDAGTARRAREHFAGHRAPPGGGRRRCERREPTSHLAGARHSRLPGNGARSTIKRHRSFALSPGAAAAGTPEAADRRWLNSRSKSTSRLAARTFRRDGCGPIDMARASPPRSATARLATAIDESNTQASLDTALGVAGLFRLSEAEARQIVDEVSGATSRWREVARAMGLATQELQRLAPAFEHEQRLAARKLVGSR